MSRQPFLKKIEKLHQNIMNMAKDVDSRIEQTISALEKRDIEMAQEVSQGDNEIDTAEQKIERFCMNLLALQQPIASDLRLITGCLKIITDMERIADQCEDICDMMLTEQINLELGGVARIVEMLRTVQSMFRQAIDVFADRNVENAVALCRQDDIVDEQFKDLIISSGEMIKSSKNGIMDEIHIMFIAKYVERMGDHVTNIAEWIIYIETGEHMDLN